MATYQDNPDAQINKARNEVMIAKLPETWIA